MMSRFFASAVERRAGGRIVSLRFGIVVGLMAMTGCAQIQTVTAGDLQNAAALAAAGNDQPAATCWAELAPALMATPTPADDGIAVLAERKRLLAQGVSGPCAAIIAPMILQDLGKAVPFPANLLLPL